MSNLHGFFFNFHRFDRFSFCRESIEFFPRVDRVNSEYRSTHPSPIDSGRVYVSGIRLVAVHFEADTTRPSRTGLGRFFECCSELTISLVVHPWPPHNHLSSLQPPPHGNLGLPVLSKPTPYPSFVPIEPITTPPSACHSMTSSPPSSTSL